MNILNTRVWSARTFQLHNLELGLVQRKLTGGLRDSSVKNLMDRIGTNEEVFYGIRQRHRSVFNREEIKR